MAIAGIQKDVDAWIAPTNENRLAFIVSNIISGDARIDILTVAPKSLSYDEAEKNKNTFEVIEGGFMELVPYNFLKDMKLRSARDVDLRDIARLEELRVVSGFDLFHAKTLSARKAAKGTCVVPLCNLCGFA